MSDFITVTVLGVLVGFIASGAGVLVVILLGLM